jgi:hypothetical protein
MLRGKEWQFVTYVLGQPISTIFKGQEIQKREQSTTERSLTQSSFLERLGPSSNFLKKQDISEANSISVFQQRTI